MTTEATPSRLPIRSRSTATARRWRPLGLLAAVLLPVIVVACGSDEPAATALADGTYAMSTITGRDLVEGSTIDLVVDGDTIGLGAGCNRLFGGYSIDGDRLVVDQLASTKMACSPELMDQDDWLIGMLSAGPRITADGQGLTIADDTVTIEFSLVDG